MGCECIYSKEELKDEIKKKDNLQEEKESNNNNEQKEERLFGLRNNYNEEENQPQINENNEINEEKKLKYLDYPERILELINKIREDPVSYAEAIEDSIQYITEEQDKNDIDKTRIIFKKKVKVALTRGEPAFHEAADILRNIEPIPPLEFKNDICIPLPKTEADIKKTTFLKDQVKILKENNNIEVFFKDLVKIPEVSALLMIVDDSGKNPGKKRQAVLNKDFKFIGINSTFIGKTFIAYFSFSK